MKIIPYQRLTLEAFGNEYYRDTNGFWWIKETQGRHAGDYFLSLLDNKLKFNDFSDLDPQSFHKKAIKENLRGGASLIWIAKEYTNIIHFRGNRAIGLILS